VAAFVAATLAATAQETGTKRLQEQSPAAEQRAEQAAPVAADDAVGPSESNVGAEAELPDPGGKKMAATPTGAPPVLDGVVDDDVWELADVVSDFLQREPVQAARASERTEARILFDDRYLYVGLIMFDSDPGAVIAQDLRRDSRMGTDDTLTVVFDTFHDHRNGFIFQVNALGTKYDATLRNEQSINSSWDEKWDAAAQVTERGWEAELRIPLKILRYRTGTHVWGVDFQRQIRRRNEEVVWSNYRQDFDFRNVSQAGHLVGLTDLRLTDRFRFKPFATGGVSALNASEVPVSEGTGDIGIEDFKVQITPNLTADLTVNTDFAQVEDDQERVNLTRFPLFFPERREFFLEGADKFEFGIGGERRPSALIYHSRNIGLNSGLAVPMFYGAKMTGKLGKTSVGFINSQTGAAPDVEYNGRNYTALRVAQDVFARSQVGMIVTNVQDGDSFNRVAGVDANFRLGDFFSVGGYAATASDSEVDGQRWIGAFSAGWSSDLWSLNGSLNYIDPDFNAELGFLRRTDVITQRYSGAWKPRPAVSWLRQVTNFLSFNYATDSKGDILEREYSLFSRSQLESGDSVTVNLTRGFERLDQSFSPAPDAEILPGDYTVSRWRLSFESFRARRLSGAINVSGGGYYDGTRENVGGRLTYRFNERFSVSPSYDFNHVGLPTSSFSTHVAGVRASYNFSDRWLTSALVQYNSLADRMSLFARLNFIHRPGDDFFLVYKSTIRYDPEFYGQADQALIAKATRSWDF
jgi:hypothetical protein